MPPSAPRIILVTGASSGIGHATAQLLASRGHRVYAAARRVERLAAMRTDHIIPLPLDVTDDAAIPPALDLILQREGHLDVLINGAGYGLYGTIEEISLAQARDEFAVNVFGLAAITQHILPIMRAQRSGRIINLSSVAGKVSTPLAGWYAASKHAVEALSDALRLEVAHLGIQVVLIEPGAIKTEFDEVALSALDTAERAEEYRTLATSFTKLLRNSYQRAPGSAAVARVVGQAVAARHPRARYALPLDSRAFIALKRWGGETNLDRILLSQIRGA